MSTAKLAAAWALAAVALSACGTKAKPIAGSAAAGAAHTARGAVDDPRTAHVKCLQDHHLAAAKVGRTGLQVGTAPSGPTVTFAPTPGAAQDLQIDGQVESAEVIGSALLYPKQASDGELRTVESCLAVGVAG